MFRKISHIIIKPDKYLKISLLSNTLCTPVHSNPPVVTIVRSKSHKSVVFTEPSIKKLKSDTNLYKPNNREQFSGKENSDSAHDKNMSSFTERQTDYHETPFGNYRYWHHTNFGEQYLKNSKNLQGTPFVLMSYNILAQDLLDTHNYLYSRHDQNMLNWPHRFKLLMHEIQSFQPQILCLQEVQDSHLNTIHSGLKNLKFKYVFKKRTGFKSDGCAIFYNSDLFDLVEEETVEYYQPGVKLLNRENVAIIVKLALKSDPSTKLVVATTHLLYNPRRQDVRLAQIQVLLAELDRVAYDDVQPNGQSNKDTYVPIILTGDFNLQPHTAPYRLLTQGFLQYDALTERTLETCNDRTSQLSSRELLPLDLGITDHCRHIHVLNKNDRQQTKLHHTDKMDLVESNGSESEITIEMDDLHVGFEQYFSSGSLKHDLNLTSAYSHIHSSQREASTFQNQWITVDYVFYSRHQNVATQGHEDGYLKLLANYRLPTQHDCCRIGSIPNKYLGSDHLSLTTRFLLQSPKKS